MITEMTIQNFKMFENLTVSGLSRLNLIGGKNGTGKSTLLEAIFMMHYSHAYSLPVMMQLRGMMQATFNKQDLWEVFFHQFDSHKSIFIKSLDNNNLEQSLKIKIEAQNNIDASYSPEDINISHKEIFSTNSSFEELQMIFKNSTGNITIKESFLNDKIQFNIDNEDFISQSFISIIRSQRESSFGNTFDNYFTISKNNEEHILIDIINKILDLDIVKFELSPATEKQASIMYVQTESLKRKIPIYLMAEGLKHILHIMSYIISQKCGILLIDEIENGLHYSVLPKLWAVLEELADKYDMQIFATTHDEESIKVFADLPEENRSYIRLDKDDNKIEATVIKERLVDFLNIGFEAR